MGEENTEDRDIPLNCEECQRTLSVSESIKTGIFDIYTQCEENTKSLMSILEKLERMEKKELRPWDLSREAERLLNLISEVLVSNGDKPEEARKLVLESFSRSPNEREVMRKYRDKLAEAEKLEHSKILEQIRNGNLCEDKKKRFGH